MTTPRDRARFWQGFLRAAEVEPRSPAPIQGASGLWHPVVALGIDDARHRAVIVSGDADGRSAALAQADLERAFLGWHLIYARPILISIARAAAALSAYFGKATVTIGDLKSFSGGGEVQEDTKRRTEMVAKDVIFPALGAFDRASVDVVAAIQDGISQLSRLEFLGSSAAQDDPDAVVLRLGQLAALDPAEVDRRLGVCSIPLYEFTDAEAEVLCSAEDIEHCRAVLTSKQIIQYFFPPPDHLALGLIEKGALSPAQVAEGVARAPILGHPFGPNELVRCGVELAGIVDSLRERGYIAEGEISTELTTAGEAVRQSVRFRPREGVLARLARVVSVKIDLSLGDLFGSHR